jgi:hypothetical protein
MKSLNKKSSVTCHTNPIYLFTTIPHKNYYKSKHCDTRTDTIIYIKNTNDIKRVYSKRSVTKVNVTGRDT